MVRFSLAILVVSCFSTGALRAQQTSVYEMLPDSVQAVVWVRDAEELRNRWTGTLFHELANDPKVKAFFELQQESIQKRLLEAGWRLGVHPRDLAQFLTGQMTLAWMDKAEPRKPYMLALMAEIAKDSDSAEKLMEKIEAELSKTKASKKQLTQSGQAISHYVFPKRPGQLLEENTYLTIAHGHLLVTDDLPLIHQLVGKLAGQSTSGPLNSGKSLAQDEDFIAARQQLKISDSANIEYFVRPLGIAKVLRDIGGKRSRSGADLLAILKNQGFTSVKCVSGEIWVGQGDSDISHRGFVLANMPLAKAAAVLDFPNKALTEIPKFVGAGATSYLASNWNAQDAFWKVEPLVDELAGTPDTFKEVINGLKKDINGPQVDIRSEVLPLLTNDIVAVTDNQAGEVQINSRRNMIAIRVTDSSKAIKVVDRVMKGEAQAVRSLHAGVAVWEIAHQPIEGSEEFSDFGANEEENADQTWLNQWAICVNDDWILFSSHADMLRSAIDQSQSSTGHINDQLDYVQAKQAILSLSSENPCAWKISRNQMAYRIQYELFRQGKLQESESMLATLLSRLSDNNSELKDKQSPLIKGDTLPPYEEIAKYLRPSGFKLVTTDNGWAFGGLMIGREPTLSSAYEVGTARFGSSNSDSKR